MWLVKIVWRQKTFKKEFSTSLTRSILQEPDKSCSLSKCHSLVARRLKQLIRNAHNIPLHVFTVHKPCRTYLCLRGREDRHHQKKCKNTDSHCLDSSTIEDEPNTTKETGWVLYCPSSRMFRVTDVSWKRQRWILRYFYLAVYNEECINQYLLPSVNLCFNYISIGCPWKKICF